MSGRVNPVDLIEYIDDKISRFIELRKWDKVSLRSKREWVSNFTGEGEPLFAYHLLNRFVYYSDAEIRALTGRLLSLLRRDVMVGHFKKHRNILPESELNNLLNEAQKGTVFTYVLGENGRPCGSGVPMLNHFRGIGVPESQTIFHYEILKEILLHNKDTIVLVDDFIGTGTQAANFWTLPQYESPWGGGKLSLQELAEESSSLTFYYLALVGSSDGIEYLREVAPDLRVIVSEVLTNEYSVFGDESLFWRSVGERDEYLRLYDTICSRVGIDNEFGYGDLSLALAFSHGIPDNSLPIFFWDENGWNPLFRRP